jgi:hypothetical protein
VGGGGTRGGYYQQLLEWRSWLTCGSFAQALSQRRNVTTFNIVQLSSPGVFTAKFCLCPYHSIPRLYPDPHLQTPFAAHERMSLLFEAVQKQDAEKVEVRRPLEAGSSTESGPSRGVCLGLGRWTLDAVVARSIRPCCVESRPYGMHQPGKIDNACRRSSVPVMTSISVTRTLPCRLAESHNFSPPPSPAIAVPATFSSLPRLMDARAGCEMATTPSPLVSTLCR